LLLFAPAPDAYANSGPPPSILIIVRSAPGDLEMSIGSIKGRRTDRAFESYYVFYSGDLRSEGDYTLNVSTGRGSFEIALGTPLQSYNNIFTLDLGSRSVTAGESASWSLTLLSIRIVMTLIAEGTIFFLFDYRKRISWIIFLVVNLLTQGVLYLALDRYPPLFAYIVFSLIFGEILVFLVETIAFMTLIDEHSRLRTFLYVVVANLFSLAAGYVLITTLPT